MELLQTVLPGVDLPAIPPKRFFPHTPMTCAHCGATHPYSEGLWLEVGSEENFYCDDSCAQEDDWVKCEGCDTWLTEDDAREYDYDHYCDECWGESFFSCERCDADGHRDDMVVTPDSGECYCDDCFSHYYYSCACCDNYVHRDSTCSDESGDVYCEDCYDEHFFCCHSCGDMHHNDDIQYSESSEEYYCQSCYDELDDDEVGDDYHTGNPTYNNVGRRRFGVELEYNECTHHVRRPYFKDVAEYTGREYVSGIMYSDGGLEAVRDFAEYADNQGWTCADRCGYHLHIDCSDLSIDQLKSVAAAYIQSRHVWYALVEPWRKTDHPYSTFDHYNLDDVRGCDGKSEFIRMAGGDRFKFINWNAYSKHRTVEIRGHEATRDVDEICNWITAHTRFVDHVSQLGFDEVSNMFKGAPWRDFKSWKRIVGNNVAAFYKDKAERHGNRLTTVTNSKPQMVGV